MLTLLLGTDRIANRDEILSRLARDVREQKENRILMVPELISHDTERRLAAVAGDTASRYAQVLSFTRLARRVTDIVGNASQEFLDDSGRVVVMASAARQLHSLLKTYAAVETKPEFLSQLVDAVDEFKRCCISPADLKVASAETQGLFAQKLEELALLMDSYDSLCARAKRDPRDRLTWALEQLEQIDFAQKHVFYVDGFPDFTRQNMAILEHIIRVGGDLTVSLTCDRIDSTHSPFETAARTAKTLYGIARRANIEVHIERIEERNDALKTMRRLLMQGHIDEDAALAEKVQAVRAGSVYRECQVAAKRVMQLVQSGQRYRDIAIVCPQLQSYAATLRMIFGQCEIPLYLTGTEDVLENGVMSTVTSALEAALGGFEQRDVLRYLRSTLSPLGPDACDRMENYAVIWGISGKRWLGDWTEHPQGLTNEWDDHARRELADLNADRARAIEPLSLLSEGLRAADNIAAQVSALYEFLQRIRFPQRLEVLAKELDERGDGRTAQIYDQLWEILLGALEQLYDTLGSTVWENDTFVRLLKLLLGRCNVGTIPPVLDAVSVGAVSAMRCQQQKFLIVLGANEGALPSYGGSTGLLSDSERITLRKLGVPLTGGAMDGLQEEYAEIYDVFCGAEEEVTVTCSDAVGSFIFRRLAQMAGGERAADTTLVTQLRRPSAAGAFLAARHDAKNAARLSLERDYRVALQRQGHRMGLVSAEHIRGLYGDKLRLSASQVDCQAECRLHYFLKYGLRARERKEAKVDPAQFGTYVHDVLEKTGRAVMERGGFHHVTLEQTLELAHDFSKQYLHDNFGALESQRMDEMFRRNMLELEAVVRELWRELREAQYEPRFFELKFDEDGAMPAVDIPNKGIPAQLRGFVDRVDLWYRGESSYVRVVDYKTGRKEFDYCDVFNGVGLQMLIYLFALEKAGENVIPGKRISAGVQYFPARAPYLSVEGSMSEEEADAARRKASKRSGLLLLDEQSLHAMDPSEKLDTLDCSVTKDGTIKGNVADRESLGLLSDYMMKLLGAMAEDIASGNIEPNPYTRGKVHDACSFCPYGAVCHKQSVAGGRNYKALSAEEFWQGIGKEMQEHG